MFKVGEMVRCINGMESNQYKHELTTGEIYEVVDVAGSLVTLRGVEGQWLSHRFELAPAKEEFIIVIGGEVECTKNTLQEALDLGSRYSCDAEVKVFKLVKTRVVEKTWR